MRKRLGILLICLSFILTMAGCGSTSTKQENKATEQSEELTEGFADNDLSTHKEAKTETSKKLIKTAEVIIEAKDVADVYREILTYAKENGGYEFSQSTNNREDSITITATIKIKPENLDGLLNFAGTKGDLISSNLQSEDITDSYYDSEIHLNSLRNQLNKYNEFLKNTSSIDEMIRVQKEIDNLITQIEVLEGQLSKWDKQVAESTVSFTITQKVDPSLKRREINWNALSFGDMGYLIKSGIVSVLNVVVSILQWLLIILLVTAPIWLPVAVILLILFRKRIALYLQKFRKLKRQHKNL